MIDKDYIAKWKAAGEMWRLELAKKLFRTRAIAAFEDDLASVQRAANEPANGLTNRQRREMYRDERKGVRELISRTTSSF
jgi:hypothetical protein